MPFANVPITATLLQRGANFRFVTINNGIRHDEALYRPGFSRCSSSCLGMPSRELVSPKFVSSPRSWQPMVMPPPPPLRRRRLDLQPPPCNGQSQGLNFGAVVVTPTPGAGNPGQIQTGNVAGKITVRAAVVGTPGCFAEGRLTLQRSSYWSHLVAAPLSYLPVLGNSARATVGTQPGRREVDWTIQGPALGCVITRNPDNSANIVRGAQRGRVTVRATDHRDITRVQ